VGRLDCHALKIPKSVVPDNILKHLAMRMRQDMGIAAQVQCYKDRTEAEYVKQPLAQRNLLSAWVRGCSSDASREWAHGSSEEAPFFVPPESIFAVPKAVEHSYAEFQLMFAELPSFPAVMIREMRDFSGISFCDGSSYVEQAVVFIKRCIHPESSEVAVQDQKPEWEVRPDGLLQSVIRAVEATSTVIMPQSSCTTSDDYRHIEGPKVSFLMFGEGVYIQKILQKHIDFELSVPFSVQDEVVNCESPYSVVSLLKFEREGELVVVLEASAGKIARDLGKGCTLEDSQACIRDSVAAVIRDASANPDTVHVDFTSMPMRLGY
jgi:hypothetical protein